MTTACGADRHGSVYAYGRYGCRCPEAVERARRKWRERSANLVRGLGRVGGPVDAEVVAWRAAEVARLTRAGLSAREVAVRMWLSPRTVVRYRTGAHVRAPR